jgi:trans-aconitate 2-methyltransferase
VSTARERDWDAATYDRISDPQFGWALEQLERLKLAGDEVVLDAGCGTGRVTAELVRRAPRGRVYGVDVAPSMVAHARRALGASAAILRQDLIRLDLPEAVDVVFSNAAFHWVHDHDALFAALHRAMKPGAQLLAQCGGLGNIDAFRKIADAVAAQAPFAPHFKGWRRPWNYASAEETAERLRKAGFVEVETWLQSKRVVPEPGFVQTVSLVRHLDPLPEDVRPRFVKRVLAEFGEPLVLDYVRLNMSARRGLPPGE